MNKERMKEIIAEAFYKSVTEGNCSAEDLVVNHPEIEAMFESDDSEVIQIETFVSESEYIKDGDLPFDKKVVIESAKDKINKFLIENKVTKVHDISRLEYQGELELTLVFSMPSKQFKQHKERER